MTCTYMHPDAIAVDAAVEVAAVLVLLEEGVEGGEERHAALVEHELLDHVVRAPEERWRNRQAKGLSGLHVDR